MPNEYDIARADYEKFLMELSTTEERCKEAHKAFIYELASPLCEGLYRRESFIEGDGLFTAIELHAPVPVEDSDCVRYAVIAVACGPENEWTQAGLIANHSPSPNAIFKPVAAGYFAFFASQLIKKGDEITVNYRQVHQELYPNVNRSR